MNSQTIAPNNVPIYLQKYNVNIFSERNESVGKVMYTTVGTIPSNEKNKRIWSLTLTGFLKPNVDHYSIVYKFSKTDYKDNNIEGSFENIISGTFNICGRVLDASKIISSHYSDNDIESTLTIKLDATKWNFRLKKESLFYYDLNVNDVKYPLTRSKEFMSEKIEKKCTDNFTSKERLGELIVNKIIAYNGKGSRVYGVPGAGWYLEDQYIQNAIDDGNIIYKNITDETSAVFAAAYDSEVTEDPKPEQIGVAFTTAGPGVACAINGIANADTETKSVVVFCGYANNSNFQFIDSDVTKPITRKIFQLTEDTLNPGQIIDDAFYIARFGTTESPCRGPVILFVNQTSWRSPYFYNSCIHQYQRKIDYQGIDSMINKICNLITPKTLMIIRIGERVDIDVIQKMAEITKIFKNIYIHLTFLSKPYLDYSHFENVGYEGPDGMAAPCIKDQYEIVDIVIDLATDIELNNVMLVNIRNLLQENAKIFFILSQTFPNQPEGSNANNTLLTDPNIFSISLLSKLNACMPNLERVWESKRELENRQLINLILNYKKQKNKETGVLTIASFVCQILWHIYSMQEDNIGAKKEDYKLVINDENLYSYDIGTGSFIVGSFIFTKKVDHQLAFAGYSSIGISIAGAAGRSWSKHYKGDIIEIIGDGGYLNFSQSFINLVNSVCSNPRQRCLFILINDFSYTNVANGERKVFGYSTKITSTIPIQNNIQIIESLKAMIGPKCVKTLILEDMYTESVVLEDFIKKWYKKDDESFSVGGFYLLEYRTQSGYPRYEAV